MSEDDALDCREAAHLISASLEDAVAPVDVERLRSHFVVCATCRNVDAQMSFLRAALRRLDDGDRVAPSA